MQGINKEVNCSDLSTERLLKLHEHKSHQCDKANAAVRGMGRLARDGGDVDQLLRDIMGDIRVIVDELYDRGIQDLHQAKQQYDTPKLR